MNKDVYVSIDLDYFESRKVAYHCLTKALHTGISIPVAAEHHQLLHHVNQRGGSVLINIDAHDDIQVGNSVPTEANWVEHVAWRGTGEYIWHHPYHPDDIPLGYCGKSRPPEWDGEWDRTGWKSAHKKRGIEDVPWKRVQGVGIAISARLVDEEAVSWFAEDLLGLSLKKGRALKSDMARPYWLKMIDEYRVRIQSDNKSWVSPWVQPYWLLRSQLADRHSCSI